MGGFHLYRLPNGTLTRPFPLELESPPGPYPDSYRPQGLSIVEPLTLHSREEEIAEHPLEFWNLPRRALAYLAPSETEIKDKGKADVLTKVIAIIQTLWFVAQCIARGARDLPLTEMEVVALAYTTVNAFIYYFWWDKPKDVGCPVRVYTTSKTRQVKETGKQSLGQVAMGMFGRIIGYTAGVQDEGFNLSEEIQMPMFWSGNAGTDIEMPAMLGASTIGIAFGATHFIAWNSEFPSYIELLLWRISCIAITAAPLILALFCSGMETNLRKKTWVSLIALPIIYPSPLILLLYFFSRIATLVMAFTTLRALPSGALETVDWTTFIPHI